jgi:[ribosomal protein S18]-alanine N-acetyltransferase
MAFRRYQPEDLAQCLEIYAANEPGGFPKGVIEQYRKSLIDQSSYFLVLDRENRLIASGGISYFLRPNIAVLCFGLVHPDFQGSGLGTALLLTRLALLEPRGCMYAVFIAAVEKSVDFYRRFGFWPFLPWVDHHGQHHPSGRLSFSSKEIVRCRQLLAEKAISFPQDEKEIPLRTKSDFDTPDIPPGDDQNKKPGDARV